jgi:hypothetical protein
MALNLELVKQHATVFGAPVYAEVTVYGTVSPKDYVYDPTYNSVKIDLGDGTFMSAQLRRDVDMSVFDPAKTELTVACFQAQRDASGEIDGRTWSVNQGDKKDFAYIA